MTKRIVCIFLAISLLLCSITSCRLGGRDKNDNADATPNIPLLPGAPEEFDYLTSDLSQYLEFTEDYKNFTVEVDIAKPKSIDVDISVLILLASDKNPTPVADSTNTVIGPGDVVEIYYKGYIFDEKCNCFSAKYFSIYSS